MRRGRVTLPSVPPGLGWVYPVGPCRRILFLRQGSAQGAGLLFTARLAGSLATLAGCAPHAGRAGLSSQLCVPPGTSWVSTSPGFPPPSDVFGRDGRIVNSIELAILNKGWAVDQGLLPPLPPDLGRGTTGSVSWTRILGSPRLPEMGRANSRSQDPHVPRGHA